MTYIDKDKALNLDFRINVGLFESRRKTAERAVQAYANAISEIPAADVRPVVRARWQYKTMTVPGGKGQTYAKWCCTACKGKAKERTNFCPNCGADMRGEQDV